MLPLCMADKEFFPSPQRDYLREPLRRSSVDADPMPLFDRWLREAALQDPLDAHSMTLATADGQARPSARIVLLKRADQHGFVFFTNYGSRKARELEANPWASLVFYWSQLERQVRWRAGLNGFRVASLTSTSAADPRGARSPGPSHPRALSLRAANRWSKPIAGWKKSWPAATRPGPPTGGGFRLRPAAIEFWKGRPTRLHDRILYTRLENDAWGIQRLAP